MKVAFFIPNLRCGGAERVMVNIANGFTARGLDVDLVLTKAEGPYLRQISPEVRIIDLKAPRILASLPGLVRYLRCERPKAFLSVLDAANIVALWAKRLSGTLARVVVSVHIVPSVAYNPSNASSFRERVIPLLMRLFYPWANKVVAVSQGVAKDVLRLTKLPQEKVRVIYNPVVTPELFQKAQEPITHPWFALGEPPVILGAGRLTKEKNFPALICAFALVRRERPARLVILGEGEERPRLEALVREMGLERDMSFPGFVENPYAYMARASVFALSSAWEALPTVLIEAMALGTPVVSTNCPYGPEEILDGGKYGMLVPAGDVNLLAKGLLAALDGDVPPPKKEAWSRFTLDAAITNYLDVLRE